MQSGYRIKDKQNISLVHFFNLYVMSTYHMPSIILGTWGYKDEEDTPVPALKELPFPDTQ